MTKALIVALLSILSVSGARIKQQAVQDFDRLEDRFDPQWHNEIKQLGMADEGHAEGWYNGPPE